MAVQTRELVSIVAVLAFIGLFGGGTILGLSEMETATYEEFDVVNESHQPSGTVPVSFTVNNVYQGLVEGSETVDFFNATTNTETTLTKGTNYTVNTYDNGTIVITDLSVAYDDTADEFRVDYTYKKDGDASSFLNNTINAYDIIPDMLRVVVVFGFIAVLISLLWFAIARTGMMGRMRGGL